MKVSSIRSREVSKANFGNAMYLKTRRRRAVKLTAFHKQYLIFTYGVGLSGFNLLLLVTHASGMGYFSREVTVPYRIGFLGFAIVFLIYGIAKRSFASIGILWIPFLIFWLLYFARIAVDGFMFPVFLAHPPLEYVQKAAGIAFFPSLLFLMRLGEKENALAFKSFWCVHLTCLVFALILYKDFIGMSYRTLRYTNMDASVLMSPILLAYLGVIASVVSYQILLKNMAVMKHRGQMLFLLMVILSSMVVIIFSGTRSALLVWLLTSLIITLQGGDKRHKARQAILIIGSAVVIGIVTYALMQSIGASMLSRYENLARQIAEGDPEAGSGRLSLYKNVISQIAQEPILGSGLEEISGSFPHNSILEAFMATGVLGGFSFIILCWSGVKKSILILDSYRSKGWIACIFLVLLFRGFISTPIIDSSFWYSLMAVYSIPIARKDKSNVG